MRMGTAPDDDPACCDRKVCRIEEELLEAMQGVREHDGIEVSEQVRRAIREWLNGEVFKSSKTVRVGPTR